MFRSHYFRGIEHVAFICGCGHTGTTLMATILSVHPQIYAPEYESEVFFRSWWRAMPRLRRLRDGWKQSGKPWLVEKTPRHIRRMKQIRRAVPGAKFIIMVRDGRDVTASIGRREHGNFRRGLERWRNDVGIAAKEQSSPDVLIQRYEDFVLDPQGSLQRICAFLGVEYSDDLLNYHQQEHHWHGVKNIQKTSGVGREHRQLRNWQVNQPVFDGRGRWQSELPPEYITEFSKGRIRTLMETFGYDVSPAPGNAGSG